MDTRTVFAARLALFIEQRGRGATAKVARIIGVAPQTLRKYLKGESMPPLDVAASMAELFKCQIDYLAGRIEGR